MATRSADSVRGAEGHDSETTPEARWRAAVATAPLESTQPLTGRWAPLARMITGRAETRFTSGSATRRALRATGALGATTGTVIHLSRPPSDRIEDDAVISHELGHSRTPVQRPRFLLTSGSGHDEEERGAHRSAPLVQRAMSPAGAGAGDTLSRFASGLVDTLPVTGIGGLLEAARTASGPYAGTAYGGGMSSAAGLAAAAGLPALPSMPAGLAAAGGSVLSGFPAGAEAGSALTSATAVLGFAGGTTDSPGGDTPAGSRSGAGAGPTTGGAAGSRAAGAAATDGPGGVPDLDRLLEALEDNALRELERRGGRYEGVF